MQKIDNLTIIIIAKNEAENLKNLLPLLRFTKEIILVDSHSTDQTKKISEKFKARYLLAEEKSFAALRNQALAQVKTPWLFYLDADERPTPELIEEIALNLDQEDLAAMSIDRENICYGFPLKNGGWNQDRVTRVFQKKFFTGWQGDIHESPIYKGKIIVLKKKLRHLTHRSTRDNLLKSADWTIKEARLFQNQNLPPVTGKTILRKPLMEFYRRYWQKKGYRDGVPGFIESFIQAYNRGLVYIQIWELQQQPSLTQRYQAQEDEIANLWKRE